jgi:hypothetical protein
MKLRYFGFVELGPISRFGLAPVCVSGQNIPSRCQPTSQDRSELEEICRALRAFLLSEAEAKLEGRIRSRSNPSCKQHWREPDFLTDSPKSRVAIRTVGGSEQPGGRSRELVGLSSRLLRPPDDARQTSNIRFCIADKMRRLLVDCREPMPAVSVRRTDDTYCHAPLFGLHETRVRIRLWDRVALAFSPRSTRVH